jgi:hypothetical protein
MVLKVGVRCGKIGDREGRKNLAERAVEQKVRAEKAAKRDLHKEEAHAGKARRSAGHSCAKSGRKVKICRFLFLTNIHREEALKADCSGREMDQKRENQK